MSRVHMHFKAATVTVSAAVSLYFLKFMVEWDFTKSLLNFRIALKFFLAICVFTALCESSFSKLKSIKNYLLAKKPIAG